MMRLGLSRAIKASPTGSSPCSALETLPEASLPFGGPAAEYLDTRPTLLKEGGCKPAYLCSSRSDGGGGPSALGVPWRRGYAAMLGGWMIREGWESLGFCEAMTGGSNAVNKISLPLWLIFVVVHDRHRRERNRHRSRPRL